jgi:outer membrane protein
MGFLGVALVLGAAPVVAQQVPVRLTLDDALELAREWNPAYRRAVVEADATGPDVRAAAGAFLPNLNANLGFSGSRSITSIGEDDFGGSIRVDESRTIESSSSSQGFSSSITLFDGLQNLYNLKSSKAGAEAAHYGVDFQAVTLDAQIKTQFYQVVYALRSIEIEQEILQIRNEDLLTTERLFRVAARPLPARNSSWPAREASPERRCSCSPRQSASTNPSSST